MAATPVEPIYVAAHSLGMDVPTPPGVAISRRDAMQELWETVGLVSTDTRVIRVPVSYSDFEDFWASNSVPVGPLDKFIQDMLPSAKEQLCSRLCEQLPVTSDGHIAYEAFANAVKGRVPG